MREGELREREREKQRERKEGVDRLTSWSLPLPSLLPSTMQRALAALTTLDGERAHRGPAPSHTSGLPRHSVAGERKKKRRGLSVIKEIPFSPSHINHL